MKRLAVLLPALALALAACQQKVPYPTARGASPAVPPAGLGREGARLASQPDPSRGEPPAGDAPAAPAPEPGPLRPVALVRTPDGTLVLSSRPGGADVAVHPVKGWAWLLPDGTAAVASIASEPWKAIPGAPESRVVRLAVRRGGPEAPIPLDDLCERPDLAAAAKADPDLAKEFYHRERLTVAGALGPRLALALDVEGFLGGAHPYRLRRLLVLDLSTGALEDLSGRFQGRDLAAEVLGEARETTCARRPVGVAPVEGRGGVPAFVVGLAHDVESCAGEFRLARLPGAAPEADAVPAASPGPDGRLELAGGLLAGPLADWRRASEGGPAVLLMGIDGRDRAPSPWEPSRRNGGGRELRWWEPGLAAPVVLGRASGLLSVQFLPAADEAARRALDAL